MARGQGHKAAHLQRKRLQHPGCGVEVVLVCGHVARVGPSDPPEAEPPPLSTSTLEPLPGS